MIGEEFSGAPTEDVSLWLFRFNGFAASKEWDDKKKLASIPAFLKDKAAGWTMKRLAGTPDVQWKEFEKDFIKEHTCPGSDELRRVELEAIRMEPGKGIMDFIAKFDKAAAKVSTIDESTLKREFLRGLDESTFSWVRMLTNEKSSLADMKAYALKSQQIHRQPMAPTVPATGLAEILQAFKAELIRTYAQQPVTATQGRKEKVRFEPETARMYEEGRCFCCGDTGHQCRECPNKPPGWRFPGSGKGPGTA